MTKPTLEHPVFGRLNYEDAYNWWEGQVEIHSGKVIDFSLSTRTGSAPKIETDELLRRGVDFLVWARRAETTVQEKIADKYLEIYNDFWTSDEEDGRGELSREQFLTRIEPNSIVFHTEGSSYWYYSDGDLFAGHTIEVRINVDREITEICLAG